MPGMVVGPAEDVSQQVAALDGHCATLHAVLDRLSEDGAAAEQQQGLITAGSLALLNVKVCRLDLLSYTPS